MAGSIKDLSPIRAIHKLNFKGRSFQRRQGVIAQAYQTKLEHYRSLMHDESPKLYCECDEIEEAEKNGALKIASDLKEASDKLHGTASALGVLIERKISPALADKIKESISAGSLSTAQGRMVKLKALKELGGLAANPLVLLQLASLVFSEDEVDETTASLHRIEKMVASLVRQSKLALKANLEDKADRLKFYLSAPIEKLGDEDKQDIDRICQELHREVLSCAGSLEDIRLNKPQSWSWRDYKEAVQAASSITAEDYELLEHALCVMTLFMLSKLCVVKADIKRAYRHTWSFEEILLNPVMELISSLYAGIIVRLKTMQEGKLKSNILDRSKIKALLKIHEERFLALNEKLESFLRFYGKEQDIIYKVQDGKVKKYRSACGPADVPPFKPLLTIKEIADSRDDDD